MKTGTSGRSSRIAREEGNVKVRDLAFDWFQVVTKSRAGQILARLASAIRKKYSALLQYGVGFRGCCSVVNVLLAVSAILQQYLIASRTHSSNASVRSS